jgi:hypothetical protein
MRAARCPAPRPVDRLCGRGRCTLFNGAREQLARCFFDRNAEGSRMQAKTLFYALVQASDGQNCHCDSISVGASDCNAVNAVG